MTSSLKLVMTDKRDNDVVARHFRISAPLSPEKEPILSFLAPIQAIATTHDALEELRPGAELWITAVVPDSDVVAELYLSSGAPQAHNSTGLNALVPHPCQVPQILYGRVLTSHGAHLSLELGVRLLYWMAGLHPAAFWNNAADRLMDIAPDCGRRDDRCETFARRLMYLGDLSALPNPEHRICHLTSRFAA